MVATLSNAAAVAWVCLVVGLLLVVVGGGVGLWTSLSKAPATAKDKIEDAKAQMATARTKIVETRSHIETATAGERAVGATGAATSVEQARASADAAQSALEQVEGIVASLPENLRFAGVLVLIGTVLMSVATIQFGGVSLF
jgi:hypothetical protein